MQRPILTRSRPTALLEMQSAGWRDWFLTMMLGLAAYSRFQASHCYSSLSPLWGCLQIGSARKNAAKEASKCSSDSGFGLAEKGHWVQRDMPRSVDCR